MPKGKGRKRKPLICIRDGCERAARHFLIEVHIPGEKPYTVIQDLCPQHLVQQQKKVNRIIAKTHGGKP